MAYMHSGLMGGFSGRIGAIVGYMVNGRQYIRRAPGKRTRPVSAEQMIQREKFSLLTKFFAPVRSFINEVHKHSMNGKSGSHKLFSINYKEALQGEYPDFAINYHRLRLTMGSLQGPRGICVSCAKNGFLDFHWFDNSCGYDHANPYDRIWLAFYDEDEKCWEIKNNMALRMDSFLTIHLGHRLGNRLQIYAGFTSPDGKRVSNSQYLGMIYPL